MSLPSAEAPPQDRTGRSLTSYKITIATLTIALVVVSLIAFSVGFTYVVNRSSSLSNSQLVDVSGQVKSTGANTGATQIIFARQAGPCTSLENGANICYSTVTVGIGNPPASPGTGGMYGGTVFQNYNALLIGGSVYDVKVVYAGAFNWQGGAVDVGTFSVATSQSTMSQDFTVNTPDSWVGVSGVISLTGNQTVVNPRPLTITWMSQSLGGIALNQNNPSDRGGAFTALVTGNNHFSLNVPNHENYDLAISWISATGTTGTCYVATFIGIGVITVAVEVGNGLAYYTYNPNCNVSNQGV